MNDQLKNVKASAGRGQREVPLRILLGGQTFKTAQGVYAQWVQTWKAWEAVSREA